MINTWYVDFQYKSGMDGNCVYNANKNASFVSLEIYLPCVLKYIFHVSLISAASRLPLALLEPH